MKSQFELKRIVKELERIDREARDPNAEPAAQETVDRERALLRDLSRQEIFALIVEATKEPLIEALSTVYTIRRTLGWHLRPEDMTNFPNFKDDCELFTESHDNGLRFVRYKIPIERWQPIMEEYLELVREYALKDQHLDFADDRVGRYLDKYAELVRKLASEGHTEFEPQMGR